MLQIDKLDALKRLDALYKTNALGDALTDAYNKGVRRAIKAIAAMMPEYILGGERVIVDQVHAGQYSPYGDTYDVWKIYSNCQDIETVKKFCCSTLARNEYPSLEEYMAMKDAHTSKRRNADGENAETEEDYAEYLQKYFHGYYDVKKIDGGWEYTIHKPFTD